MAEHASIPGAIRRAAANQEISDARLAELSLIPRTSLLRKLAGVSEFTVSELIRIADALKVSPADLISVATDADRIAS